MQEFILITILVILLFRIARRFIFFKAYQGFQKAAEDFMKKQQPPKKPEGSVTIQDNRPNHSSPRHQGGEYVDYEEVR